LTVKNNAEVASCIDDCYMLHILDMTYSQQVINPMVPQRIMWPSIARANGQLDPRCS